MKVILPNQRLKEVWDFLILCVTFYLAVQVPLSLAFNKIHSSSALFQEALISALFFIDIFLNFFTGYHQGNQLITDKAKIRRRYLRGWFLIDLIAALPFFLIPSIIGNGITTPLRILRLLQLPRLLKLSRTKNLLNLWQQNHFISQSVFRLSFFGLGLLITAHWLACIWILLGGIPMADDIATVYSKSIYWVFTTLATVGYGDIVATNNPQRYFAIVVMIAGVGSYGYLIGNMASFIANLDVVKSNYRKKIEEVEAFLNYKAIPPLMRKKVMNFYQHLWESRLGLGEEQVLADLPLELQRDLALQMRREFVLKVPFFKNADPKLLSDLVMKLRPKIYIPDAYIMRKGEPGHCMYIVANGSVDVLSSDEKEVLATLTEGSFVGEMALLLNQPRTASVRAREYSDLYILDKSDFQQILKNYPVFHKYIREITAERLRQVKARQKGK